MVIVASIATGLTLGFTLMLLAVVLFVFCSMAVKEGEGPKSPRCGECCRRMKLTTIVEGQDREWRCHNPECCRGMHFLYGVEGRTGRRFGERRGK